jgi:DNA adenine methylase
MIATRIGGSMRADENSVLPFLKWAGGKRWLTQSEKTVYPENFNIYFEPFLGSGAVFFFLNPEEAVLSDSNAQLIEAYQSIKDDWERVETQLKKLDRLHSEGFYYQERSRKRIAKPKRAAQFIYLNRTCWNGLYRVNQEGSFNVPKGTKTKALLDTDNFELVSNKLQNAELIQCDFKDAINQSKKNDFIFADPPYTVKHNTNGFLKYNEKIFSWEDQERLSEALIRADKRGVKFTLTNANHKSIKDLYKDFFIEPFERHSVIASDSKKRKKTAELIITNWEIRDGKK